MTAKTFLQGLSGLSVSGSQVWGRRGSAGRTGVRVPCSLRWLRGLGLALRGSGGEPPQYAHTARPAQAGHLGNKGGGRAGAAPGEGLPGGELAALPLRPRGTGHACQPHLWWESGPDPAIMELRKPEKNNASEMQREEEEVEGGRRDPEPGDLSVSVFKEANGPFPGKHLEHFKGNGNCLKRQRERRPRQPSAAGMDV